MPRTRTKLVKMRATDDTEIDVRVPTSISSPPKKDLAVAESMFDKENWKYPTKTKTFKTESRARAIGRALSFYLGGYEIVQTPRGWQVGSKGYYHYIGA
ncbi:MAG: hypothetical protein PHQ43_09060 [Dehalococcoidales bacterium]|nr:hypothetical protein [Dehalococcoidales bacterium]